MNALTNKPSGSMPVSFVVSHCRNCAAGWTRIGKDGGVLTVCLLDRELVWPDMSDCDRYEPREKTSCGPGGAL